MRFVQIGSVLAALLSAVTLVTTTPVTQVEKRATGYQNSVYYTNWYVQSIKYKMLSMFTNAYC